MLEIGLSAIIFCVFILPIVSRPVEKNLEIFLMAMGALAVTLTHFFSTEKIWSIRYILQSLYQPLGITFAVLFVGIIVYKFNEPITNSIVKVERRTGSKLFALILVIILGLISSIITATMAAIILVEIINCLKLDKRYELKLVILACFSIGLGAVLTPIGEPLSALLLIKLKGEPFNAGFFFLMRHLGKYIFPGIAALGILAFILEPSVKKARQRVSFGKEKPGFERYFSLRRKDLRLCYGFDFS